MRLFVAVWPPQHVLDAIAALPRPGVVGLRWTTPEQWHVTLRFLGRVDDPAPVVEALASLKAPTCSAFLGPEVSRFGRRVLQVPVAGLETLATEVIAATADFGEPPEDRRFAGHITLARVKDPRCDLRGLCGTPVSDTWQVEAVSLVESRLHPRGARYQEVASFPLGEARSPATDG